MRRTFGHGWIRRCGALVLALTCSLTAQAQTLPQAPTQSHGKVYYYYTDTLHSAVVETDAAGTVLERTYYAPFGSVLNRSLRNGPGYTGHEEDAATGLVYMQQRYYDPQAARFISIDPVQVTSNGGSFNRYWYAQDNPYRYTDPDGRCPVCAVLVGRFLVGATIDIMTQHFVGGKAWGHVDLGDAAVAGLVSTAIPGVGNLVNRGYQGAKVVAPAAKAIIKIASKSANTANRAVKNASSIARNIDKIEAAAADVGKAALAAGAHQVAKAAAQSKTPQVKASDVQNASKPPPPSSANDGKLR